MNSSPSQTDVGLQPTPSTSRSIAFFLLAVAVLEIVVCLRMPREWKSEWDRETSMLVTNSVWRKATLGMSAPLSAPQQAVENQEHIWNGAPLDQHYLKQFGAGIFVLAAFAPRDPDRMERYLLSSRYVAATLSIIVVAALLTMFMRRCGLPTGLVLLAYLAFDDKFLTFPSFLRSLYWLPGLSLLPLAIVLALYDVSASSRRRRLTLGLFGGTICLRALCGYEYISVPILASFAAIIYLVPAAPIKVILRDSVRFIVAGGVGTALAIMIHAFSLYVAFGSWEEAYRNTIGNAVRRSFGEHEVVTGVNSTAAQIRGIYGTLAQNKLLTIVIGLWGIAIIGYAIWKRGRNTSQTNDEVRLRSLAAASLAGLAATSSWFVLMRTHTAMAPQYNSMAFYLSFIWFAIPFLTTFFSRPFRRL